MNDLKETWSPGSYGFEYPDAVNQVTEHMNAAGFEEVMANIPVLLRTKWGGTDVAILGDEGSSTVEAAALYFSFANGLSKHNLIKAEHIRQTYETAGITDHEGKTLPLIAIASPSRDSTVNGLNGMDRWHMRDGYLFPIGERTNDLVRRIGYGKVSFLGHSAGGAFAIESAAWAHIKQLDVAAVAPSDVPGPNIFKKRELITNFTADADFLEEEVVNAGLQPYTEALGYDKDRSFVKRRLQDGRFVLDVLSHPVINYCIFSGLTKSKMISTLRVAADYAENAKFVIGYGTNSSVVNDTVALETQLGQARWSIRPRPDITTVEIVDGRHTWSDNVPLYSTFVLHAIQRAKAA